MDAVDELGLEVLRAIDIAEYEDQWACYAHSANWYYDHITEVVIQMRLAEESRQ